MVRRHDIRYPNPRQDINLEPLLVNTAGSWDHRPDAATKIENFLLASDYVRTYTDLATMEGANEAARRAVNAILDATGSREPKCQIWPLHEPALFAPVRALDRVRYQREHGTPHRRPTGPGAGPVTKISGGSLPPPPWIRQPQETKGPVRNQPHPRPATGSQQERAGRTRRRT